MRAKPPSVPSALARREAARTLLAGAVNCRDAQAVLTFTGHWVHRQGMASLPALMAELAHGETLLWWQQLLQHSSEPVGLTPGEVTPTAPKPVAESTAPAPAPMPTPAPTAAKALVPMAASVPVAASVPMAMVVPAAARPPAAQVRRGAGTSRPAPAPRNPELARLRAWLPDNDSLGGSSSRSHAA
ncbi:MAG: hypothetical protein JHD13_06215 [Synechococcales cyanobacterium SupBloom_Metag_052]|nr:hypothetical protein [Synechococcales cyanobacterium SupBloom_Metag_052]